MVGTTTGLATSGRLASYLPRIASGWSREWPDRTWGVVDGTLVFVDISGFTALSERLAARGAIGAEELTEILSSSFSELLSVAYADGGSLLKFGGDALLLLFDGEGHADRACRAALRMRVAMRRVGNLRTTVGAVRLRMSVGVHSGQVHLFRVGTSHRELLVTGPTASETVVMEGTADAGEIVVSGMTASLIGPGLVGSAKGPGFLLRNRSQEEVRGFPEAPPTEDVTDNIPVLLRDHLADGSVASEHRNAAIAFIHFDGIDDLIGSEGPAVAAGALHELVTQVQEAVDEAGVTFLATDIDHDGGKIILVGGVPRARGDDEGRVLRAVRRIVDQPRVLPVRVGVNRGHVFAGEVGPEYRKTYTVMGDAVNLAARLMAKAGPGQIYVSGSALELSRTLFATQPLEPFHVKGKAKPVRAFSLGGAMGTQEVVPTGSLPLVGRDEEISWLLGCYQRARSGGGQIVEICGEVGVGKSRLVAEFVDRASPPVVRTVRCEQYEQSTPLFAVGVLLRALIGAVDGEGFSLARLRGEGDIDDLDRWGPLVLEAAGLPCPDNEFTARLGPDERVTKRARSTARVLERLLPPGSLLVVEDVQWLDDASGHVLSQLLHNLGRASLMCCLTRRAGGGGGYTVPAGLEVETLSLGPLTDEAASQLVRLACAATPMPSHRRNEVVDRAGGNPLFLEQLARAVGRHIGDDQPLHDSLEAVVAAELDDLQPVDGRLLGYAAVLGDSFDAELLAALAHAEEGIDLVSALERVSALIPDFQGRLRFRHRLVRDVAYGRLPYRRRRQLHLRAGQLIEERQIQGSDERAAILSFHYFHAGEYARACDLAAAGAQHAKLNSAPVEAVELFQQAITAARRVPGFDQERMATLWVELSRATTRLGDLAEARRAIGEAYRCSTTIEDRTAHCADVARFERDLGRPVNALRWVRRGLRLLGDTDTPAAAKARAALEYRHSFLLSNRGHHLDALEWAERALVSATVAEERFTGLGDHDSAGVARLTRAHVLLHLADVLTLLGRPGAEDRARTAAGIYDELGEHGDLAIALNNLGAMNYARGRWAEAVDCYTEARERFLSFGAEVRAGYGSTNAAEIFVEQGRLDEARALLDEAAVIWTDFDFQFGRAIIDRLLGRIALRSGDVHAARRHLASAAETYERYGIANRVIEVDTLLAECDLRDNMPDVALAALHKIRSREEELGVGEMGSAIRRLMAYAHAALGDVEAAWAAVDESLQIARERDCPIDVALALEALSVLPGIGTEGADPVAECERILDQLGIQTRALPPGIRAGVR